MASETLEAKDWDHLDRSVPHEHIQEPEESLMRKMALGDSCSASLLIPPCLVTEGGLCLTTNVGKGPHDRLLWNTAHGVACVAAGV